MGRWEEEGLVVGGGGGGERQACGGWQPEGFGVGERVAGAWS